VLAALGQKVEQKLDAYALVISIDLFPGACFVLKMLMDDLDY
jgi:hypothetical protein